MKKLNYSQKRQIVLSAIAVITLIIVVLGCVLLIYYIYGQALFSAKSIQLKKAEEYAELTSSTQKNGVVFVGDSIFELYKLDKYYKGKDYINRGISSNKSADVLARLQSNVIDLKPNMVIIHVGTNDIGHFVSDEDYLYNMSQIIDNIQTQLPECKILIDSIYPTRRLNNYNSINLTKTRDNKKIRNVNEKLKNLCVVKNVKYINTHNQLLNGEELHRDYTIDGLHLNDLGYKVASNEITKEINQLLID